MCSIAYKQCMLPHRSADRYAIALCIRWLLSGRTDGTYTLEVRAGRGRSLVYNTKASQPSKYFAISSHRMTFTPKIQLRTRRTAMLALQTAISAVLFSSNKEGPGKFSRLPSLDSFGPFIYIVLI